MAVMSKLQRFTHQDSSFRAFRNDSIFNKSVRLQFSYWVTKLKATMQRRWPSKCGIRWPQLIPLR